MLNLFIKRSQKEEREKERKRKIESIKIMIYVENIN